MDTDSGAAIRSAAPLLAALVLLGGCEAAQTKPAAAVEAVTVTVTVTPSSLQLAPGGTQLFSAVVTNASDLTETWEIQEGSAGGSVTAAGLYTAPAAAGTYHVVARSTFDTAATGRATVTVTATPAISVAVTPAAPSCQACGTLTFQATVSGTTNQAVSWSILEGSAGGTITSGGVYVAPAVASATTIHVVATSQADPTRSKSVPVAVSAERVLSVIVLPGLTTIALNGTARFTASVATTCGTSLASGTVPLPVDVTVR